MIAPLKPMLALDAPDDLTQLPPMWVQPKYDGVRCLIDPTVGAITRKGLALPNPYVRSALAAFDLEGLDGELLAPGGFEAAQSAFMGAAPPPAGWRFVAFDMAGSAQAFPARMSEVRRRLAGSRPDWLQIAPTQRADQPDEIAGAYAAALADGHEGVMLRADGWGYREGRAGPARLELLRLKPHDDTEAIIVGAQPRSDDPSALGMVAVDWKGRALHLPVGVSRHQARALWADPQGLAGATASVRHMGFTATGLPRCAVFKGLRRDL